MSEIDIRDGGLVVVDTTSLEHAATRYAAFADRVRGSADDVAAQIARLNGLSAIGMEASALAYAVQQAAWQVAAQADDLIRIAADLRSLAAMYEIVEQRARLAVASSSDRRARLQRALTALEAAHPDQAAAADWAIADRSRQVGAGLASVANAGWLLPASIAHGLNPLLVPGVLAAGVELAGAAQVLEALLRMLGNGTIEPGARLRGAPPPVELERVGAPFAARAPADLGDALARIPGDEARIRIETYEMADGSSRYAVYLAGTRDFAPVAGADPWDMTSNLQLYFGADAAAAAAVRAALADAGVPRGARVYLFGHSQGGMIADRLAMQEGYDTRLLVTAGSPTEAAVGDETLSVQLRHTDDLVQALAAGGSPARVGAAGSMVVEATGDPWPGWQDLQFAAHHLPEYVGLARALDATTDPRATPLRARLGELQGATTVTAREYDARRPTLLEPAPRPSPAPAPRPEAGRRK